VNPASEVRLIVEDERESAARVVADLLAEAAGTGQQVVLTGGSTPGRAYELAAELRPDWSSAGVWWGDERCVPPDDELSNYRMAKEKLLDRLDVQPAAVHRIRGELDPEEAAREYEHQLRGVRLDLLLLGIGPDGHVASLFPNEPTLGELERLVIAADAKHEPFVERVTLTLPALTAAARIVFLATGEEKADAVRRAFGETPSRETPASLVRAASGDTTAVLDRAAGSRLPR
jgi:6-phosphogluconolactonase